MCLREIKNCNLFIGCYGERYGSCYDEDEIKELTEALTAPQYFFSFLLFLIFPFLIFSADYIK